MEDDWASPWADADDRSQTKVIKNLDVQDAARSGGNELEQKIPDSSIAVHANDPWGSGEHGFGDASAWASPSPAVGSGEIPAVGGENGLLGWGGPEVPSLVVEKPADEKRRSLGIIGEVVQQTAKGKTEEWLGHGVHSTSSNLPIATGEADIWAAGSDWGGSRSEQAEEQAEELPVGGNTLSPEPTPENIPLPKFDGLIEGVNEDTSIHAENSTEIQFVDTTILDQDLEKPKTETNPNRESIDFTKTLIEGIPPATESEFNTDIRPEHESGEIEDAKKVDDEQDDAGQRRVNEEEKPKDEEVEDDDFGDFADEGGFEDAEGILQKDTATEGEELPPLPSTPGLRSDITFDIPTSLVNKFYPIFTSYPEPPPIEELIHTTNSRKAWYRLSQSGTIRKDKSGDDDYIRVTWHGSKVQEDVNKIVNRWMTEDRNSGSGVALGGSRRLGAMFGWGEGVKSVEKKAVPAQLNLAGTDSSGQVGFGGAIGQGAVKSPFSISTATTHPPKSAVAPSPQTPSFGWSSMDNSQPTVESHPGSSAASTKGEDKPPSTPSRASFHGTPGPSRVSSQPATPSKSTTHHSPISSNHSRHSLAVTQPSSPSTQSIRRSTEVVETTLIPSTRTDTPFSSIPTAPGSADLPAMVSAPSSNFDEWGTFESMATATVRIPSAKEANGNFDEWGTFEDMPKPMDTKPVSGMPTQSQTPRFSLEIPEKEEKAIGSKENEWSAFEASGVTSKAASLDGSSKRSSTHAPTELVKQPDSKGKTDDWGPLAAFEDPLTIKASKPDQPLNIPPTNVPKDFHVKPVENTGLNAQRTDDWGSSDAFENNLTLKPSVSVPQSNHAVEESKPTPIESSSSKVQNTDNWGSFEAFETTLTSNPSMSSQSLRMPPVQTPKTIGAAPKGLNKDNWGSFDAFGKSQSKPAGNFNLPTLSTSHGTGIKSTVNVAPLVLSVPATTEDDDDDWGEMVQSPQIPNGGGSFVSVLQPTSTSRAISPAPPQFTQPQPQAAVSTMSMYDFSSFGTKTPIANSTATPANSGGTDTWDLSFFDGPGPANKATVNASTPSTANQPSHDLWDAPAPTVTARRLNTKELEEDKAVSKIVEGLPDLSYMLS